MKLCFIPILLLVVAICSSAMAQSVSSREQVPSQLPKMSNETVFRQMLKSVDATEDYIIKAMQKYGNRINALEHGMAALFGAYTAAKSGGNANPDGFCKSLDEKLIELETLVKIHGERLDEHDRIFKKLVVVLPNGELTLAPGWREMILEIVQEEGDKQSRVEVGLPPKSKRKELPLAIPAVVYVQKIVHFRSELCEHAFRLKPNVTTPLARGGYITGALYDVHGSRVLVLND